MCVKPWDRRKVTLWKVVWSLVAHLMELGMKLGTQDLSLVHKYPTSNPNLGSGCVNVWVWVSWVFGLGTQSVSNFGVEGGSQTTLTRQGRQAVLEMSMLCRFFLIAVKEFLLKC